MHNSIRSYINNYRAIIGISCFSLVALIGCAETPPLISHAHIGHSLTAWHDTPNQEGLFITAQNEAELALNESKNAWWARKQPNKARWHLNNVMYALNPDLFSGRQVNTVYGVIRALDGSIEHIEFAATSNDASLNIVSTVAQLTEKANVVVSHFEKALVIAQSSQNAADHELEDISFKLKEQLSLAVNGVKSKSTVYSRSDNVYSLDQLNTEFLEMLARESNPAYQPISQRYLFGLVRVESGDWVYDLQSDEGYGSYEKIYSYDTYKQPYRKHPHRKHSPK